MPLYLTQNILISAISASRKTSISSGQVSERSCLSPASTVGGAASPMQRDAYPENLPATRTEAEAISCDFESGLARTRCNLHKRFYTFVEEYRQTNLFKGSYSRLQSQGLPAECAEFFLDPWNTPYWIRDRCDRQTNRRIIFVDSFGPNRRRHCTRTEIQGDDIGSTISSQ